MPTELIVAVVFIAGFAIQQILQILDPFLAKLANRIKSGKFFKDLASVSEGDIKKAVMYLFSFGFGMITILLSKISLLGLLKDEWKGTPGDFLVSALVVGSGTEAANTFLKFFGYIKDARKAEILPPIEVLIIPASISVNKNAVFQFQSIVRNTSDMTLEWAMLDGAGGTIESATGKYTAPPVAGTYRVIAASKADRSRFNIATITVPN